MQDFYGDTPFIIGNKKQKGRRKHDEIQSIGINGRFLARLSLLFIIVVAIGSVFVFRALFTVQSESRTYYAVCFYEGQSKTAAETVRDDIISSGGSGYVICSGAYKVYGGMYAKRSEADVVASRQSNAFVETLGWKQSKIGFSSRAEATNVKNALSFYCGVADKLVESASLIVKEEESSVAVKSYAAAARKKFSEYSASISDEKLSLLFERAAVSINTLAECDDADFLSVLRYVAQDLVVLRGT